MALDLRQPVVLLVPLHKSKVCSRIIIQSNAMVARIPMVLTFVPRETLDQRPVAHLSIKISSYQYRNSHYKNKTVSMLNSETGVFLGRTPSARQLPRADPRSIMTQDQNSLLLFKPFVSALVEQQWRKHMVSWPTKMSPVDLAGTKSQTLIIKSSCCGLYPI